MKQWLGIFASLLISSNAFAGAHAMGEKPMAEETMTEKPMAEAPMMATGSVGRSAFTTMIENREPSDNLGESVGNNTSKVYFFTELVGLNGHNVTHRWTYNGRTMAELSFNVGSDRWRVWSSKNLVPEWLGKWSVEVLDGSGNVVSTESFIYQETAM